MTRASIAAHHRHAIAMPELYDDRRQEPRFRTAGSATIDTGGEQYRALVLDLSLNGLKLTRPDKLDARHNARFRITLSIGDSDPFLAEVKLVHTEPTLLGLEFFDMPPRDFAVLAGIIETFERLRRQGPK